MKTKQLTSFENACIDNLLDQQVAIIDDNGNTIETGVFHGFTLGLALVKRADGTYARPNMNRVRKI